LEYLDDEILDPRAGLGMRITVAVLSVLLAAMVIL